MPAFKFLAAARGCCSEINRNSIECTACGSDDRDVFAARMFRPPELQGERMKSISIAAAVTAALSIALPAAAHAAETATQKAKPAAESADITRGRYLVKIAGCNDCHTAGYIMAAGKVPEKEWLLGDTLGWRGPWGTTYASNLRLYMRDLTEMQWLHVARNKEMRPPMPWFNLRAMTDGDLSAIYRYIRHLGSAGKPAPDYLPPDREPKPPFVTIPGKP
jgi:mono/diheme cytochrome c family protein